MYIKGRIRFKLDNFDFDFSDQPLSVFGVTGLPWHPLSPHTHFGRKVDVQISIPSAHLDLTSSGRILRESTTNSEHMGVHFTFTPEQQAQLNHTIKGSGYFPTSYIRKYPRIPATNKISVFPMRATITAMENAHDPNGKIIFEVANLSPNGLLVFTENQTATHFKAGSYALVALEPRGWFQSRTEFEVMVCRIMDNIDPISGNLTRHLGLKISRMNPEHRASYMDLLKHILDGIRKS